MASTSKKSPVLEYHGAVIDGIFLSASYDTRSKGYYIEYSFSTEAFGPFKLKVRYDMELPKDSQHYKDGSKDGIRESVDHDIAYIKEVQKRFKK